MMTPQAEAMEAVVRQCAPLLKDQGFKKRRHSFNRSTSDGLFHAVRFWMAPFEPPAWTEVPGLRERSYGGFRLDFGVYVPEMQRTGAPRSEWVNDYQCQLRSTIWRLINPASSADLWWDLLGADAADLAEAALRDHGLPWLARFTTREDIFQGFEAEGALAIGLSPAGALDIADAYASLGRHLEARRALENYVATPVNGNHAQYLAEYLLERGHEDLIIRIQKKPRPFTEVPFRGGEGAATL